ncbi:MAG: aminotransferase class V-fold PLP-dependent enzyme, partial [Patescibacteria group bacterium]
IVAVGHCSNVLGNINDVVAIGKLVKNHDKKIFFIVDGAQAVAHIPVDVQAMQADFYAFSGHKMYGPDGVGGLYIARKIHHLLTPTRMGGGTVQNVAITFDKTGDIISPDYFPSLITLEGGTPNLSNILGLSRAVNFIRSIGFPDIQAHERGLLKRLLDGLATIPGVQVFGPTDLQQKIGVLSFGLQDTNTKELGEHLGRQKICIRYGAHCAFPLAEKLGQETLRISLGVYNTEEDIDHVLNEMRFFFDKKQGRITNPNLEPLRNKLYYRSTHVVNSYAALAEKLQQSLYGPQDTEIIVMGGHFLGIPDMQENRFWPSIATMVPERLHGLMDEFGMTSFPLFTWRLACRTVADLKAHGYQAKLAIIANDTTGMNELRNSEANTTKKTAEQYRTELLDTFQEDGHLPNRYSEILKEHGLHKRDILKNGDKFVFQETLLRANFKKFVDGNKNFFDGIIAYTKKAEENIDLSIKLLDNQEIASCTFNTFQSKTGGKFCIVELCQFIAELFGKPELITFPYVSQRVLKPKVTANHKILFAITPAMCDNAVTRSAELYTKLFLQEQSKGSFKFFNLPLGPNAERSLAMGAELKYVSDKDNLEVLDIEHEPAFPDLWRLAEYKLIYNAPAYVTEMTALFAKLGLTKKSALLDTCVGPGFFATELLRQGYNLHTADKSETMMAPFRATLKELGINHQPTVSTWLDLPKHFEANSMDMLFNRGNTFIYAAGGWHERITVDREKSLAKYLETLRVYYSLLKPGGYLYVDKFRDAEIPDKKVVARLYIQEPAQQKDVVFYVERKPEDHIRFAQMLLRDTQGKETGLPNMAYDLSVEEMEMLLQKAGFKNVQQLKLAQEKHFVVWLAQK